MTKLRAMLYPTIQYTSKSYIALLYGIWIWNISHAYTKIYKTFIILPT